MNHRKLKKRISNLIVKYQKDINQLEQEREELEYDPAPSGETNEYHIECNLYIREICVLENVVINLQSIIK